MAKGYWASCDDCDTNTVIDGDGKDVPDPVDWDSFPNCLVCGGTLHFDEMPETIWEKENRLMQAARDSTRKDFQSRVEPLLTGRAEWEAICADYGLEKSTEGEPHG